MKGVPTRMWTHTASAKSSGTPSVVLESIDVTPLDPTLDLGDTQQLLATGNYSDASTADLTALVTWASDDASATVDADGLVTAVSRGSATITATLDLIEGSTEVSVVARVYPNNATEWATYYPTVYTPDNLYTMQENGLPSDQIGSRHFLTSSATPPSYLNATSEPDGRVSVKFTTNTTFMRTNTSGDYDMGTAASGKRMTVWMRIKIPPQIGAFVQQTILAHMNGGIGWRLQLASDGSLSFEVYDAGDHVWVLLGGNHMDDAWHDIMLMIDRTANGNAGVARCLSDIGGDSGEYDLSTIGNNGATFFRFGFGTVNVPTNMEIDYCVGWYGTTANQYLSPADFTTLITPI